MSGLFRMMVGIAAMGEELSMGSTKCVCRHIAVCAMASMWLAACANNATSASISSVDSNEAANASKLERAPHLDQPHIEVSGEKQGKVNRSPHRNIVYNKSSNNIEKGVFPETMYQAKRGDTLYYIAKITGNDYRILAKQNTISAPYTLKIGQMLKIDNGTKPIGGNALAETLLPFNTTHTDAGVVKESIPISNQPFIASPASYRQHILYNQLSDKPSIKKILTSFNRITLPTVNTVITTTAPISPSSMEPSNPSIIDWRWPTDGKTIANFSSEEGGNKGIDISGSRGQLIVATANGRVVYAGNALRGYGNLIILKHNDDYLSAYAHNDTLLVREKQEIKAGQKIATMGNTGTSTTRLHFEIRYKGKSVNPLRYLPQR